jgi:hypothetical protein
MAMEGKGLAKYHEYFEAKYVLLRLSTELEYFQHFVPNWDNQKINAIILGVRPLIGCQIIGERN